VCRRNIAHARLVAKFVSRSAAHFLVRWAPLAAGVYVLNQALARTGLASPSLFAALVVGITYALLANKVIVAPRVVFIGSQAVIGVGAGALMQQAALRDLANHWELVLLFSIATIGMSVALGVVLARLTSLDSVTAAFGMMAGGAQGIVAMSHDLGADERLVATMQYLRVVIIVTTVPIVAGIAFGASGANASGDETAGADLLANVLFVVGAATVGLLLARLTRLPTGALLGPMVVAAAVVLVADSADLTVPPTFQSVALAGIGLSVGLRFTAQSLRAAGKLLSAVVVAIIVMIVVCAGVGAILAPLAHVSQLAGYLATSPGGLSVVVGIAVTTETDGPFVVSLQVLRLFLILLSAPILARALVRRGRQSVSH
jgi:membrane AbrB-like protein